MLEEAIEYIAVLGRGRKEGKQDYGEGEPVFTFLTKEGGWFSGLRYDKSFKYNVGTNVTIYVM